MAKQHGSDPATIHFTITPSANVLTVIPRCLYVKTDGVLEIEDSAGTKITYNVLAGQVISFRPTKITSNTTATIIGWV